MLLNEPEHKIVEYTPAPAWGPVVSCDDMDKPVVRRTSNASTDANIGDGPVYDLTDENQAARTLSSLEHVCNVLYNMTLSRLLIYLVIPWM